MSTQPQNNPPALTGGSKQPLVSQKIHWLEGTFRKNAVMSLPSSLPTNFVETRPFNSYNVGKLYEDGRIELRNTERPEMGVHLLWQGQACDKCPMDLKSLVEHLFNANFSFTRIDLAVDCIDCNLRPQQATEELKYGRCKTRAKLSPRRDDPRDPGYTQSVGKKTSEIFLKLYDKAVEMGAVGDHTRIELTVRQRRADYAAREIIRDTDYRSLVVSFAHFPQWREWMEVMAITPVKLPSVRTETNTKRWLLEQCAPALARELHLTSDWEFYERFKTEVMKRLEQLSKNGQVSTD